MVLQAACHRPADLEAICGTAIACCTPFSIVKRLYWLELGALLAESADYPIHFYGQATHMLLTDHEALVVWLLILQRSLAALDLHAAQEIQMVRVENPNLGSHASCAVAMLAKISQLQLPSVILTDSPI